MENTHNLQNEEQTNVTPPQTYTITTPFGDIEYKSEMKLSHGSFMQLLYCYNHRLTTQVCQEGNKWQELAYPEIRKMFSDLLEKSIAHVRGLCTDTTLDRDVITLNFCGYKNFKLPLLVHTMGVHYRATYGTVNVKPFLKTIEQRLAYLANADVPARYLGNEEKSNTFNAVKQLAKTMLTQDVLPMFETWNELCNKAATYAGIIPTVTSGHHHQHHDQHYHHQHSHMNTQQHHQYQNQNNYQYNHPHMLDQNQDGHKGYQYHRQHQANANTNGRYGRDPTFTVVGRGRGQGRSSVTNEAQIVVRGRPHSTQQNRSRTTEVRY